MTFSHGCAATWLVGLLVAVTSSSVSTKAEITVLSPSTIPRIGVNPVTMPFIGTVDERYQSYNVEMLEVTGGKFWKPYGPELDAALRQPAPAGKQSGASLGARDTPAGMNPALYDIALPSTSRAAGRAA